MTNLHRYVNALDNLAAVCYAVINSGEAVEHSSAETDGLGYSVFRFLVSVLSCVAVNGGGKKIGLYFLDDSVASYAKEVIERLNVVKTVNITPSSSKDHPGNTLTVYPKSMVDVEDCEKEMIEALNGFFSLGVIADRKPVRNDAYFNLIADKIIKDLDKARVSIHVCIAWFTNQNIADKLVEKYKQGIDVKVIFYDDHTNSKFGVNIDGIPFKAVRGSRGGLMHNKYCVIDNQIVITGSYNWSENAEKKNDENTAVMYDYDRASDYSVEFRKMFATE